MDEFVDLVVGFHHRRRYRLPAVEAGGVGPDAVEPVLPVLGGLHVLEEPQDVRIVRRRLPKLVQLSGKEAFVRGMNISYTIINHPPDNGPERTRGSIPKLSAGERLWLFPHKTHPVP